MGELILNWCISLKLSDGTILVEEWKNQELREERYITLQQTLASYKDNLKVGFILFNKEFINIEYVQRMKLGEF